MITDARKKILERQGYRLVGNHSGTKTCHYCRQGIKGRDVCYKNIFYGIKSWGCVQASVSIDVCNLKCQWCWRDINYTSGSLDKFDEPKAIVDGLIKEHLKLLKGFYGGNGNVDFERLKESERPKHVALSLTGEVCLYPKLPELIDEFHNRGMTTFVVTNGTMPGMLRKLLKHEPTQVYITLPAPDKETYEKSCNPLLNNGWEKILESLTLLGEFKRGTIRLTLAKGMNMFDAEKYALLLKDSGWKFLEVKGVVAVGDAVNRVESENIPSHEETKGFAEEICRCYGWKIIAEKEESRVVLVMREDFPERFLSFD